MGSDVAQQVASILHVYKEKMFDDHCDMPTEYEVIQEIITVLEEHGYAV